MHVPQIFSVAQTIRDHGGLRQSTMPWNWRSVIHARAYMYVRKGQLFDI